VIRKFHAEMRKHDREARTFPGTGALMVVDGMAAPNFLLEMDAVLTKGPPDKVERVPFGEVAMDVVKTASADGLIFVTAMPGADLAENMAFPPNVDEQIKALRAERRQYTKKWRKAGNGFIATNQ
jgi:NADPH-dependent glutamate synthase beta subunit-like oxidoreductase